MSKIVGESSSFPLIDINDLSWIPLAKRTVTEVTGNANEVKNYAFYNNLNVLSVNLPLASSIGYQAFYYCWNLTTAFFEQAIVISASAFEGCSILKNTSFPNAQVVSTFAFFECFSLSTISFPMCNFIGSFAFASCSRLISLYLLSSSVCTLYNSNAFTGTPINGYLNVVNQYGSIYVPASLYSVYVSGAENWSFFSLRFVSV